MAIRRPACHAMPRPRPTPRVPAAAPRVPATPYLRPAQPCVTLRRPCAALALPCPAAAPLSPPALRQRPSMPSPAHRHSSLVLAIAMLICALPVQYVTWPWHVIARRCYASASPSTPLPRPAFTSPRLAAPCLAVANPHHAALRRCATLRHLCLALYCHAFAIPPEALRRAAAPPLRLSTRSLAHRHADLRPASAIRPALRQRSPAHSHRLTGRRAAAFATLCSAVAMPLCATPSLRYTTMYHAPPPLIPSALCLGCSSLGHANALPCGTLRRPRVALLRPRRTLPDQANALLCGTWHRPGEAAPCPRYAIAHQRLSSLRQYPTCLRFALAQPCFAPSWLYFTVQRPRVPQPRHRFTIRALPRLRYALLRRSVAAPVLASPLLVLASPTAAIAIHRFA